VPSRAHPDASRQLYRDHPRLEIVHDTGGYLNRVFSDVPTDLVGVAGGDWLHEVRIRIRDKWRRRTAQILCERDVQEAIELSPNMAIALIGGAQEESKEELMELWARLLANAMDPNMNSVRQSFISAVRELDPPDAKIMHHLSSEKVTRIRRQATPGGGGTSKADTSFEAISRALGVRNDEVEVSIEHLEELRFLVTAANDKHIWFPSAKFREFMRACYPELEA
jgi:Abortive infection alpha